MSTVSATGTATGTPKRAGLVLSALIVGAFVCNLNISVANVALPDIGVALSASQSSLTLVAVGCTLGLAMSVLYFGALGDRYGRKQMLLLGLLITLPAAAVSAWAPSVEILIGGRLLTGLAAGMAYPTTLALITALWAEGPKRVKAIALWSGVSGGSAVLGPVLAGFLLEHFWWGSVFLIVVPVALIGLVLVFVAVPAHVNESTDRVDHLGGVMSIVMIASLVLGISVVAVPAARVLALGLIAVAIVFAALFVWHERKTDSPLYDFAFAARRMFWVPAVAGMIVFGSLVGAMFVGQQFLQNVLGYSTLNAGLAILPAAVGMVAVAPRSAKLVVARGSRQTMLFGYVFIFTAFIVMLLAWSEGASYVWIGLGYLLVGIGAGLALTPASRALTSSVPVSRVGMASGTSDLQRDLGGSIMQALFGTLLTLGYATAFAKQISGSPEADKVTSATQQALTQSFSSAERLGQQYPDYTTAIVEAAKMSFLEGAHWAYLAGAVAIVLGALLVGTRLPNKDGETAMLASYKQADEKAEAAAK